MTQTITLPWYKVRLPATEHGPQAKILENDFETLFNINSTPNGAALFSSHDEEGQEHVFYFSPGAVAIARGLIKHFAGEPCEVPVADADNPKLLVGRPDERDVLLRAPRT